MSFEKVYEIAQSINKIVAEKENKCMEYILKTERDASECLESTIRKMSRDDLFELKESAGSRRIQWLHALVVKEIEDKIKKEREIEDKIRRERDSDATRKAESE